MENLTKEQEKLFNKFVKSVGNEMSIKQMEQIIDLIENNKTNELLNNIANIKAAYNENDGQMSVLEMVSDIKKSQGDINTIYNKIFDTKDGDTPKSNALAKIQEAKDYATKIESDYRRFYNQKDSQGNIIDEGIVSKLEQACNNIENNKDKIKRFEEFYERVFTNIEADENGNGGRLSLEKYLDTKQKEIELLIKNKTQDLENCLNNYTDKFEKLHKDKNDEIDKLLPGATSAGLSEAYKDENKDHQDNIALWNRIFVISILTFIVIFVLYFYFSFSENFTYISFLKTLPFWVFSGFFTYYSTKQIAEYKRLASEYAYKQRLNQTYKGYETQIKETNNEELKNKLLKIMLDSAEYNPSMTLDKKKGEIPSLNAMEKLIDMLPAETLRKIKDYIEKKLSSG